MSWPVKRFERRWQPLLEPGEQLSLVITATTGEHADTTADRVDAGVSDRALYLQPRAEPELLERIPLGNIILSGRRNPASEWFWTISYLQTDDLSVQHAALWLPRNETVRIDQIVERLARDGCGSGRLPALRLFHAGWLRAGLGARFVVRFPANRGRPSIVGIKTEFDHEGPAAESNIATMEHAYDELARALQLTLTPVRHDQPGEEPEVSRTITWYPPLALTDEPSVVGDKLA